jgi:hypothetical protein
MSHEDHKMYWLRTGDSWTKIDYSKPAETWMKPLIKGQDTGLVEIPASWYIDDLPPMMFIKKSANSHGFVNPRDVMDIWKGSCLGERRKEQDTDVCNQITSTTSTGSTMSSSFH